jgi:membrane protein DedA with SNARE-associated domain
LSRLKGLIVALLALASCSVWNLIWIWFGYTMGSNWKTIRGKMAHVMVQYNMIALIILGLVVLFFLIRKRLKKA